MPAPARRSIVFLVVVVIAGTLAPQVFAYGIVGFTPGDGQSITTTTPTFTIQTTGFDANAASANPWLAVSTSFQVGYGGTLANTFGCLFEANPTGPGSSTYTAGASPANWTYCPLHFGVTYYWQVWFYTGSPGAVDTSLVSCDGATCHTKVMTLTLTQPVPDFSLAVSPASQTVSAPGSTSYVVTGQGLNGFNSTINLDATGLPSGVTSTWSETTGSETFTVTVGRTAPGGTFPITITGTAGGLTHTAVTNLTVVPAPADTEAPNVRAFRANVKRGKFVRLSYDVNDDSSEATAAVGVYRGNRLIAHSVTTYGSLPGHYTFLWRATKRGRYKFCVLARDAAGNTSSASCAQINVR